MTISKQLSLFANPTLAQLKQIDWHLAASEKDCGAIVAGNLQIEIARRVLADGIRIIDVSEQQSLLYGHTDLSGLNPLEWQQSYPVLFVQLPEHIYDRLVAVLQYDGMLHLMAQGEKCVDVTNITDDIEYAISDSAMKGDARDGFDCPPEVCRAALNAVMHLANYPELYSPSRKVANHVVAKDRGAPGRGPKRYDLIPQTLRLTHPEQNIVQLQPCSTGRHFKMPPHWRRGHWRRVPVGPQRAERVHRWIRPVLVNSGLVQHPKPGLTIIKDIGRKEKCENNHA